MTKKRRKAVRRPAATRRGRRKALPNWALLVIGLVAGVAVAGLVHLVYERTTEPSSGLRHMVKRATENTQRKASTPKKLESPTPKPKYDFYTILTESESIIPDSEVARRAKIANAPKEQGVNYLLQVGSFARFDDADRLKAKLAINGLIAHIQKIQIEGKGEFHRVRLGPYSNMNQLDSDRARLKKLDVPALPLRVKEGSRPG